MPYVVADVNLQLPSPEISVSLPGLIHLKPYVQAFNYITTPDTLLFENFSESTNVFGAATIATGVPTHSRASGYLGQGGSGIETFFDVPSQSDLVVQYYHDFGLESQNTAVRFHLEEVSETTAYRCSEHTTNSPVFQVPSFWGATPTFERDQVVIPGVTPGRYRLGWDFFAGNLGTRQYLIDDVVVVANSPLTVSATDQQTRSNLQVYPSPARDHIWLHDVPRDADFHILDALGRVVLVPEPDNRHIDVSGLQAGMYVLITEVDGVAPQSLMFSIAR